MCNFFPYCITDFGLWTYLQRHDETCTHLWWKKDIGSWQVNKDWFPSADYWEAFSKASYNKNLGKSLPGISTIYFKCIYDLHNFIWTCHVLCGLRYWPSACTCLGIKPEGSHWAALHTWILVTGWQSGL